MNKSRWLLLDCNNLCHRAYHTTGKAMGDTRIGILFGFLRDLRIFQEVHTTSNMAFCFDSRGSKRKTVYPDYKVRKKPDESFDREGFNSTLKELRREILPSLGYRNIFVQFGYEADDIIAKLVQDHFRPLNNHTQAIIISADKDLFQLLLTPHWKGAGPSQSINANWIVVWNPIKKQFYTEKNLARNYHDLEPNQWPYVKAIAGCDSDNVKGIAGVGEKTASKFLKGLVKEGSEIYKRIERGESIWKKNLPLVKLPFPGIGEFSLVEDESSPKKWRETLAGLGMKSLMREIL